MFQGKVGPSDSPAIVGVGPTQHDTLDTEYDTLNNGKELGVVYGVVLDSIGDQLHLSEAAKYLLPIICKDCEKIGVYITKGHPGYSVSVIIYLYLGWTMP